MTRPTTGKYSIKPYVCEGCSREFQTGTNHWGAIYACCPACGNRDGSVNRCLVTCPDTHDLPAEWLDPDGRHGEAGGGVFEETTRFRKTYWKGQRG